MENYKKKAIELFLRLVQDDSGKPSVIPYKPAKTETDRPERRYFPRCIGGRNQETAGRLYALLKGLEAEPRANIHSIMVIKSGEVILEASAPGYSVNTMHLSHSMSKTLTGISIGILIDEGKLSLSDRVVKFFPGRKYSGKRFSDMTVLDLLSMKSGIPFAEMGAVTSERWGEDFFLSKPEAPPGERFSYNSMNSFILGEIVTRVSGIECKDFITSRILSPLGIENALIERNAEGKAKAGFGIYMSCESYAKVGMMLLSGGIFEGKRILSESFIKKMTETVSEAPRSVGDYNYGLHLWVGKVGGEILLNGMLGQNVLILQKEKIIISMNAGNNELFARSPALDIVKNALLGKKEPPGVGKEALKKAQSGFFDSRRAVRPREKPSLISTFLHPKASRAPIKKLEWLFGEYTFPKNNAGILPLFVRVMQNNFTGGIGKVRIEGSGEVLRVTFIEGGVEYSFTVGFYDFCESIINVRGEKYIIKAICEIQGNGNGAKTLGNMQARNTAEALSEKKDGKSKKALNIELIFPELPSSRLIRIGKTDEGIRLTMSETPNQKVALAFFDSLSASAPLSFAKTAVGKRISESLITDKLSSAFSPSLIGSPVPDRHSPG